MAQSLKTSADLHVSATDASRELPSLIGLAQELDERTNGFRANAEQEDSATAEVVTALVQRKSEFTWAAAHHLSQALRQLEHHMKTTAARVSELEQLESSLTSQRQEVQRLHQCLGAAPDPKADVRLRVEIKKLQQELEVIDDEILIGDKTEADKVALQRRLEATQRDDTKAT